MLQMLSLFLFFVPAFLPAQTDKTILRAGSLGFRQSAITAPLPDYPTESARAGRQGKVVVRIIVDGKGLVDSTEFLDQGDGLMASSVSAALKRWRWRPAAKKGEPGLPVESRLVFYFSLVDGHPVVIDAAAVKLSQMGPLKSP